MSTIRGMVQQGEVKLIIPWIYLLTIGVAMLTVYLSLLRPMRIAAKVSEIEAMRYTVKNTGKKRKKGYCNVTVIRLTMIHLAGNKKKSMLTIFSMAFTGLFFMVVATVLSCANPSESADSSVMGGYQISPIIEFGNKEHPELEWNEVQKNNPLSEELESGNKVIIDKNLLHWYPDLKIGDVLNVVISDGDKTGQKQLEIAAIGDYDIGFTSFHYLIMAEEGLRSFGENNLNMYYRIFADEKYDADVEAELKAIVEENGRIELKTWKASYDEWNSAMMLTRGACYAFLGILGAICIMNMINTMIHNVHVINRKSVCFRRLDCRMCSSKSCCNWKDCFIQLVPWLSQ